MRQSHFSITKERSIYMPKPKTATGEKNLISKRLIELREKNHMSQRMLAHQLQLRGYDMDKNVITRIETNKSKHFLKFSKYLMNISLMEKKSNASGFALLFFPIISTFKNRISHISNFLVTFPV